MKLSPPKSVRQKIEEQLAAQRAKMIKEATGPLVKRLDKLKTQRAGLDEEIGMIEADLAEINGSSAPKKKGGGTRERRTPEQIATELEAIAKLVDGAGEKGLSAGDIKARHPKAYTGATLLSKLKEAGHKVKMQGQKANARYISA